jgi:CBS domain-containing protein
MTSEHAGEVEHPPQPPATGAAGAPATGATAGARRAPEVAADLMDPNPPVVSPATRVGDVARLLLEQHLPGVPVVDNAGRLQGVVTQADLVTRHARVHFPRYLAILGMPVRLGGERQFEEEMRHILGRTAADVMTTNPVTVAPTTPLDDVATLMAEKGADPVLVVQNDRLAGMITRADLVRLVVVEEQDTGPSNGNGE